MECTNYREQINQFIDGELGMRQQADLFRHLAACTACQTLIDGLVRMKEDIRKEQIPYPQELDDAILGQLLRDNQKSRKLFRELKLRDRMWNRQVSAPLRFVASVAVIIIVAGILLGRVLFSSTDQRQVSPALEKGEDHPQTVIMVYGMPPVEVFGTPAVRTINGTEQVNH
jgi:anti-sigma factor RsiW